MSIASISFGPVLDGNDRYVSGLCKAENRLCAFSDDKQKIQAHPEKCQSGIYHHFIKEDGNRHVRFVTDDRVERKFRYMRVVEDFKEALKDA